MLHQTAVGDPPALDDASNNIDSSEDFSELWSDIDHADDEAVVDPEDESYAELVDSLEDDSLSLSGFDESDRLLSGAQASIHGQTTMEVSRVPSGREGLVVAATAGVIQQTLSPTGGHLAAAQEWTISYDNSLAFRLPELYDPFPYTRYEHYDPSKDTPSLSKFPQLPIEIRCMIWKLATPNPRQVPGAITFITNFDLSSARAILPAPRDLNAAYYININTDVSSFQGEWRNLVRGQNGQDAADALVPYWSGVMALFHTSHEARAAVQTRFHLGCESIMPGEDKLWWDEEDVLYFPGFGDSSRQMVTERWLSLPPQGRALRSSELSTVQHLALPLAQSLAVTLGVENHVLMRIFRPPPEPKDGDLTDSWLAVFPHLKSMTLLCDPGKVEDRGYGSLVLYEPEDVPLPTIYCCRPSYVVEKITERIESGLNLRKSRGSSSPEQKAPSIECAILC